MRKVREMRGGRGGKKLGKREKEQEIKFFFNSVIQLYYLLFFSALKKKSHLLQNSHKSDSFIFFLFSRVQVEYCYTCYTQVLPVPQANLVLFQVIFLFIFPKHHRIILLFPSDSVHYFILSL